DLDQADASPAPINAKIRNTRTDPIGAAGNAGTSSLVNGHYNLAPSGGKSPHPSTQYGSDDKRGHAYPHRYLVSSDRYLHLFDQTHHMANGKKYENYTRDAQSGSL